MLTQREIYEKQEIIVIYWQNVEVEKQSKVSEDL